MSREIPRAVKDRAFKLWISGCSYRQVRNKTGMSLGAINQLVAGMRGKTPDVDQLRELNLVLSKGGSTVFDAMRGGMLLSGLNRLGVSLDQVDSYVKLTEKISSERGVESERFVESAMKLTKLEGETGKTYGEIVKDFEGRLSEAAGLEGKIGALKGEIQKLTVARAQLERELTQAREDLTRTVQEVKRMVSAKERLEKLGLERLNTLAEFIEDFEGLGFDAQEGRKLAMWRESLKGMGIDPDDLKRFVEERGPLKQQISKLRQTATALRSTVERLEKRNKSLLEENYVLSMADGILRNRRITVQCRNCGWPLQIRLETKKHYEYMIKSGLGTGVQCLRCGYQNWFDPTEVMAQIGWILIPAEETIKKAFRHRSGA